MRDLCVRWILRKYQYLPVRRSFWSSDLLLADYRICILCKLRGVKVLLQWLVQPTRLSEPYCNYQSDNLAYAFAVKRQYLPPAQQQHQR